MPESIQIPSRFNGPRGSGNGGYAAGVAANLLGGNAEVSLRSPVPLDTELRIVRDEDGRTVQALDGDTLVLEGRQAGLDLEPPAVVGPDEARLAAQRYRGSTADVFSTCFVCGKAREDSFGVFAGAVEGRQLAATPWTPPAWTADQPGRVRSEFIWAALDCPTYFATYVEEEENPLSFLVRFNVRIDADVPAETEHVIVAWPIATEGRKREAGSALLSAEGETLAVASALLVEPRAG